MRRLLIRGKRLHGGSPIWPPMHIKQPARAVPHAPVSAPHPLPCPSAHAQGDYPFVPPNRAPHHPRRPVCAARKTIENMSSVANRVLKNTGFLYAKMAITVFISLLTTRLLLNSLGKIDFGIFALLGTSISMLGFLNNAMASATQRFINYAEGEGNEQRIKSIFNVSVVLHFGIALAAGLLLEIGYFFFFGGILNVPPERVGAAKIVYQCLVASTMFTVMTVPYDAVMTAHENMRYYALVGILDALLKLCIALAVVYGPGDKLILYGALMALETVAVLIIMRLYCRRHYSECRFQPRRYYSAQTAKEMGSFAGWIFFTCMSSMVANYGQGIILNNFFGAALNAAQGIVSQLNGQLNALANSMLRALFPVIGKSAGARDVQLMNKSAIMGSKLSALLFCIVAVPLWGVLPYALQLWLKNVPAWTLIFLKLELMRTFFMMLTSTFVPALKADGHIKGQSITSCCIDLLLLPAIYLAFRLGAPPPAMYLAALVVYAILKPLNNLFWIRKYHVFSIKNYFSKSAIPVFVLAAAFVVAQEWLTRIVTIDNPMSLLLYVACAFVLFVLSVALFVLNNRERQIAKNFAVGLVSRAKRN